MRALLVAAATALACVPSAQTGHALSAAAVQLAWLKTPAGPDPTTALETWSQEMRLRTSVAMAGQPVALRADDRAILRYPLLYLPGDRALPPLSDGAVALLRRHFSSGGTLLVDNVGRAEASAAFDASLRRELGRIIPQQLQKVPPGHVVFRTFYRLDRAVGRRADSHDLEGLRVGNHYAVLYTRNDLAGALQRHSLGGFALAVVPGGETQRELALRLAVNLAMYALCLDYKDDQTHVLYLLSHRRTASPSALPPPDRGD
ncbi:MAG: DUF4159 domain-containing protein [Deltaproteobacteria bacterium]|nr:DUF4159 domain-containing protein [Deltaproteobacteria bacterium]